MASSPEIIGVSLGSSTISFVRLVIDNGIPVISENYSLPHYGNPRSIFELELTKFNQHNSPVVATGRKFRSLLLLPNISEPEAIESAYQFLKKKYGKCSAIASLGGETFLVYSLDYSGHISSLFSKNQCASGTGEFYFQQLQRMNLDAKDAGEIGKNAQPYKVSGRCSVFCKSDCTHALNKGVPKGSVVAGLASMMSDKINELLKKTGDGKIMLIGGVTQNELVIGFLRKIYGSRLIIPDEACYFEALGAAVYGFEKNITLQQTINNLFLSRDSSFEFHPPLSKFVGNVDFKEMPFSAAKPDERCILGIDVGSTTTKAALISLETDNIIASEYVYTHGEPIEAARKCYKSLLRQLNCKVRIVGLGATGSGRHIAAIHALSEGVVNEITAHAAAAVHFDPEVETIYEIGGQDAKYTFIINRVPSDYAMNEACSAGTGSFIEETALESLGIDVHDIEKYAMNGAEPPNFSDQCAAFINSDIKTALQEAISIENILAGLVYSICQNYLNRVKGSRSSGRKIFMQGGVCCNRAVPVAMAALSGSNIIVPPHPELMGAYGVALVIKEKIRLGILPEKVFSLNELAERQVTYGKSFACAGGSEHCDLKCNITLIEIEGKKYPFGGACDKYYSINAKSDINSLRFDYVKRRQNMLFDYAGIGDSLHPSARTIGLNLSFHTYTLLPFYTKFFSELGFRVVLPSQADDAGLERSHTSFCYPGELSLCFFEDLIKKHPDFIFLPNIHEMQAEPENERQRLDFNCTCVFVSGEPYYIRQAFKHDYPQERIISPTLNFANGFKGAKEQFSAVGAALGCNQRDIDTAFDKAVAAIKAYSASLLAEGEALLKRIEENKDEYAIVIVGRPYNAFAESANKSIPQKIASRGHYALPFDMLDYIGEAIDDNQYWEGAKRILKTAKIIARNKNLFAVYITNFSCGPDSMTMRTFREIMGRKPWLTLELDGHTADAGINTRIDAFIDIIENYRRIEKNITIKPENSFQPARIEIDGLQSFFVRSDGKRLPLTSPDIEVLIPSMGDIAAPLFAASLRSQGFSATALPEGNTQILKYARANASGKECLPILLCAGSLLDYIENKWDGRKNLAFFIVQGAGNCRLGQYPVFLRDLIRRKKLENVATLTLMNEDGFAGIGPKFALRGIQSIIASDVLDDVRSAIMAHAESPKEGLAVFKREYDKFLKAIEKDFGQFYKRLKSLSRALHDEIPRHTRIENAKYIALVGEIYVRRDHFSHKWLNRRFADKGFIVKDAYISEWIYYVDYLLKQGLLEPLDSFKMKYERWTRVAYMRAAEYRIKKILAKSGFYKYSQTRIAPILEHSKHIIPLEFKGEPGLTLGVALGESLEKYCGVINLGPFGCMPTRFSEAVSAPEMTVKSKIETKRRLGLDSHIKHAFNGLQNIPFLTIETDGNVYPQIIEARLEAFALQAERAARLMTRGNY